MLAFVPTLRALCGIMSVPGCETRAAEFLKYLDLQLRDALVMRYAQDNRIGSDAESAGKLSAFLSVTRAGRMHEAIQNAYDALQASVSVKLTLAALGGALLQ